MKLAALILGLAAAGSALGHGHAGAVDDSMPDAERIRFCQRVRDFAMVAFNDRERGRPMKLFEEDGSNGPRVTNAIIRRIYAEPQIDSPKKADAFGRATCNEMMQAGSANP
ncbi:MAG: hypothetical protein JNK96_07535 [Betaproteobacteria bacterium]|jgi:hypothetical protein|nr:hypothetical protein [Betaproteobacteria bacterium]HMW77776.1 hypothetical protein [Rhodocyclaceae bacterium]HNL21086.1 hypothetical protein [Rhodocyclaceae bacterium]HNM20939.1 hypothetical protein [Rhodocyclaceae bacterium]HNM80149.1 hypothetical protein [Rhodocyclaceae bacterium]